MKQKDTLMVRNLLRKIIPQKWYAFLYSRYQARQHPERDSRYITRVSHFTKRVLVHRQHDGVAFSIIVDPQNGGVDYEIFGNDVYEPKILSLIKELLSVDDTFVDVGANIGQHAIFASFCCADVFAFEPITRLYTQMSESIKANDITTITTCNNGLGNEEKQEDIYSNEINMGASSIRNTANRKKEQTIEIKRLDDIAAVMGIQKVSMMKIDVEGYELEVMQGAEKLTTQHAPIILLEYSPDIYENFDPTTAKSLYQFLIDHYYAVYDISDGSNKRRIESFSDLSLREQTNLLCLPQK